MNHQPFEDWIFEEELTSQQLTQLKAHISKCEECRRLHTAMKGITRILDDPVQLEPSPGFSQRWQILAENRNDREENLTAWVVLCALILVAGSILMVNFGRLWFEDINILQIVVTNLVNTVNLFTRLAHALTTARIVLQVVPNSLLLIAVTAGSLLAFFWLILWLAALNKIASIQRRV